MFSQGVKAREESLEAATIFGTFLWYNLGANTVHLLLKILLTRQCRENQLV
jgi:hypothetical protein